MVKNKVKVLNNGNLIKCEEPLPEGYDDYEQISSMYYSLKWYDCVRRTETTKTFPCGKTKTLRTCNCLACPEYDRLVTPSICKECNHRVPLEVVDK